MTDDQLKLLLKYTPAGVNGRQKMITQIATHTNAIGLTHLYFLPSVHEPVWNASPFRQRRNTGIVYAMYRPITEIDVTARNATGVPLEFGKNAGTVTIAAHRITNSTAHVGVLFLPSFRHRLWPGIAPSRENANVIREALVTHAIPQNSWPTVEIRITALAAAELSAVSKIASAG